MKQKNSLNERIRALQAALRDPEEGVRQKAAESLSRIEARTDLGAYARMLDSDDRAVRIQAIHLLAELATGGAIELLQLQVDGPYDDVRAAVIRALGSNFDNYKTRETREKAVDIALMGLKDASASVRVSAADVLAKFGDPRSEEALLTVVTSGVDDGGEGSQLIVSALLAFGEIGSSEAVPVIIEKAMSDNLEIKKAALKVLGMIGDSRAEDCLIEALADTDAGIRMQAAESLGKL